MSRARSRSRRIALLSTAFFWKTIEWMSLALQTVRPRGSAQSWNHREAGIHSGRQRLCDPTFSLSQDVLAEISDRHQARRGTHVRGLMNVHSRQRRSRVFVLEVNPRSSRPSRCDHVPSRPPGHARRQGPGRKTLRELGFTRRDRSDILFREITVFPFLLLSGVDISLGPEMKSTGEVMGTFRSPVWRTPIADGGAAAAPRKEKVH